MNETTDHKRINLALQGGGSHGAFTWGVLDALLEDGRLSFDGVTGASAGAMNAVVCADGWLDGLRAGGDPREAARAALAEFWSAIGSRSSIFALNPALNRLMPRSLSSNPLFLWSDLVSRTFSPHQLNPYNFNPLRGLIEEQIDFERLRETSPFKLFVAATNVRTGRLRVFREHELERDMLLASACLPFAFQAVPITEEDGVEHYWDGGYMANPALWPLFYSTATRDLLLIQINPLRRENLPDSAQEIVERVSEVAFNASLLHEMRAIEFVQRLLNEHKLDEDGNPLGPRAVGTALRRACAALSCEIEAVVLRIVNEFDDDVALFAAVLADFEAVLAAESRTASVRAEASTRALHTREKIVLAKLAVDEALRARTSALEVREFIQQFLFDYWRQLLIISHVEHGTDSAEWQAQLATVDELLKYVELVTTLDLGGWVEFERADGTKVRARFTWISPATGRYLFTDRQGATVIDIALLDLAREFKSAAATIIRAESDPLLDRALGALIEKLAAEAA